MVELLPSHPEVLCSVPSITEIKQHPLLQTTGKQNKANTQQALHSHTQYEPPLQPSSSELLTWVLSLKHCL